MCYYRYYDAVQTCAGCWYVQYVLCSLEVTTTCRYVVLSIVIAAVASQKHEYFPGATTRRGCYSLPWYDL
jgi:hypothetical protein